MWSICLTTTKSHLLSSSLMVVRRLGSMLSVTVGGLKKVKIPESVEIIGYAAFYNCRNATIILKKPRSFKVIAQTAFLRCKDVKEEIRN